ncbi:hypothetical protein DC498_08115 [Terrimonas sp.]|nr:hypothetical protein DC498_08115 [Terrimonas sp.]
MASGSTHSTESINITTENTDAKYDRQKLLHQCITLNFLDSNTFVIAFDTVEVYTGRYISTNQEQVDINAFNILIDGLESSFLAESNNTLLNIFK